MLFGEGGFVSVVKVLHSVSGPSVVFYAGFHQDLFPSLSQAFGGKRSVIHPQRSVHRPLQPQSAVSPHTHTHTHTHLCTSTLVRTLIDIMHSPTLLFMQD